MSFIVVKGKIKEEVSLGVVVYMITKAMKNLCMVVTPKTEIFYITLTC